ncbi:Sterol regulatory element-binding protein cleavage-activating protein [Aphelenchoides fujianensis]|nr:Sterol regulatory element-binding protein cleavage-activating protein [Aphelenchoides fujianensis]
MSKLQLPISSPIDVYWSAQLEVPRSEASSIPDWLHKKPLFFIQQVVVKGTVEPWIGNLSAEAAVRGSLSRSFDVVRLLEETKGRNGRGLSDFCFWGSLSSGHLRDLLPHKSCLLLSPTLFWRNQLELFAMDENVHETIFAPACSPALCPREILLGTRSSGIKLHYRTNRHRSIDYAITLIQRRFDGDWRQRVVEELGQRFELEKSHAFDEETYIHVFYRPRKYVLDYLPLAASFLCVFGYFWFTVGKFEMVKSRQGLALAAFGTVFNTLISTAGICAHFELTASLWRAKTFPYLAVILGLENVLCISRSVVYTSPTLDVPSRLSQGLSFEGFSIVKFFLLESAFLAVGWATQVPEIQEFTVFAIIGLIVDLYMQLFFFCPCLGFDLYRMDADDKQRFSLMLFNADIRKLRNYPNPRCPARYFLPSFFAQKNRLVRTNSESNLQNDGSTTITYKGHRRASSIDRHGFKHVRESEMSNRLRLLYYWTKTRIVQRLIMLSFCLWVLWLAFVVHKWRVFEGLAGEAKNGTAYREGPWISQHYLDTAPLESSWLRQTFAMWPSLLSEYNTSLGGQYITFLPPIVLKAVIPADDPILTPLPSDRSHSPANADALDVEDTTNPELKNRVYWLERQMTTMLVFSALIPFTIVVIFTLYMCCWDRWTNFRDARRSAALLHTNKQSMNKKGFVELAPLAFSRHEYPIECAAVQAPDVIVSASVNGRVFVWNAKSGELQHSVVRNFRPSADPSAGTTRQRVSSMINPPSAAAAAANSNSFVPNEPMPLRTESMTSSSSANGTPTAAVRSLVWCLAVRKNVIALGCSNGAVQLASCTSARVLGVFEQSPSGVIHIELRGNRIFLVRLNGTLEILEFALRDHPLLEDQTAEFSRLSASRMHTKPVSKLLCTTLHVITASYDHSLRIFDLRSMHISHTLNGHSEPVVSICLSKDESLLFSSCEGGRVCCWQMEDGRLLRSVDSPTATIAGRQTVELACTSELLLGFGPSSRLNLWDIRTGEAVAELLLRDHTTPLTLLLDSAQEEAEESFETRFLAVLSDLHVATADFDSVQCWDLELRAVVKQVRLPGPVDDLQRLDAHSALCCSGTEMFRITVPLAAARPP